MGGPDDDLEERWLSEARIALLEGDLARAEQACETLIRSAPTHVEGLALRAVIASERGDGAGALGWLRRATEADPAAATVRLALGRLLREQGDWVSAELELGTALGLAPGLAAARFELGRIASMRGDEAAALEHYERAAGDPALTLPAQFNRATLLHRAGRLADAEASYRLALAARPTDVPTLRGLARALHRLGRVDEAQARYAELAALEPACAEAQHMAAALRGERTRGCPAGYVASLFDEHAERFEPTLLEELGYATHRMLADLIWDARPGARFDRALDLGCGTGLLGREIRPLCRSLAGVDLSERMLALAATKGDYDELHRAELTEWLEQHDAAFDLLAAADVLPYFGDLDRLMRALRRAAAPAGLVALSVEVTTEHPYELRRSGRYAHHSAYLTSLASERGLRLLCDARQPLRREGGGLVDGYLVLLEAS